MYRKYQPLKIKKGDKFVAYERDNSRKALYSGICTATDDRTADGKKVKAIQRHNDGKWYAVCAVDAEGNRRIFRRQDGWGFLKRS